MKIHILNAFAVLLVCSTVQPVWAGDTKTKAPAEVITEAHQEDVEAMQKAMEMGMPGEAHKVLEQLAGDWTYTMTHKMAADAPEQASEGTSKNEWILGGRFLRQSIASTLDMGGEPMNYEGIGIIGYDNLKGHYVSTWKDNMSTGIMTSSAQYDAETSTMKEEGTYTCPMKGREVAFTSELKFVDADHFTYAMYETDENGTTYKMMDIQYTRKK